MRLWALQRVDPGNFRKAVLGELQVDHRDPTADVRLLEFCLSVPTEQFMRGGVQRSLARRALADRLPPEVLEEPRRGLQVADWHEDLTAARRDILDELGRLEHCAAASRALIYHGYTASQRIGRPGGGSEMKSFFRTATRCFVPFPSDISCVAQREAIVSTSE